MKIGYARVSRDAQELGRQIDALNKYGCDEIRQEKLSGGIKGNDRPVLGELMREAKEGDVIIIAKLDRLGRSLVDLINIIIDLNKRKVNLVSLGDSLDTGSATGRLQVHILGAFAEFERDIIRERTKDGLNHARSKGVRLGRPVVAGDKTQEVKDLLKQGEKISKIATRLKLSRTTVYKIIGAN